MPLIVENGSGVPDADAYDNTTDAITWLQNHGRPALGADPDPELCIRLGTRLLENAPGIRSAFRGHSTKAHLVNELLWPRVEDFTPVTLRDGTSIPRDVVPRPWIYAARFLCDDVARARAENEIVGYYDETLLVKSEAFASFRGIQIEYVENRTWWSYHPDAWQYVQQCLPVGMLCV